MSTITPSHSAAVARLGHALSDTTRARILLALRHGPSYPAELAEDLGVSRQVMSNQLACLRGCGLVEGAREGRRTRYQLTDAALIPALNGLAALALSVDPDCCGPDGCRCS